MYSLPLKWNANPRDQAIISQLDDLSNFWQASLQHTSDPTRKLYKLNSGDNDVFPTGQQIYDIQIKLRWDGFVHVVMDFMDITRNQQ